MNARNREPAGQTGCVAVMGAAHIGAGAFYLAISALGTGAFIAAGHEASAALGQALTLSEPAAGLVPARLIDLIEAFMIVQVVAGWILGPLTILAGLRLRRGASRRFVLCVAVANLAYLPIGATIGAISLIEMNRPEIKYRFAGYRLSH